MKNTKEIGKVMKWMDMEFINIQVELFTVENGKRENNMEEEYMNSQMVQFMKENGKITECMEKGFILIKTRINGKVNLLMVYFNLRCKKN